MPADLLQTVGTVMGNLDDDAWLTLVGDVAEVEVAEVEVAEMEVAEVEVAVHEVDVGEVATGKKMRRKVATRKKRHQKVATTIVKKRAIVNKNQGQKKIFVQEMDVMESTITLTTTAVSAGNCSFEDCQWKGTQRSSKDTFRCEFCNKIRHPYCSGM